MARGVVNELSIWHFIGGLRCHAVRAKGWQPGARKLTHVATLRARWARVYIETNTQALVAATRKAPSLPVMGREDFAGAVVGGGALFEDRILSQGRNQFDI